MLLERVPETNKFGLVLPPTPHSLSKPLKPERRSNSYGDGSDRHHLYWPKKLYSNGLLTTEFREHRFNSVWLLRSDHNVIHNNFDGVPFPPTEIMEAFLEEAAVLEELDVCVRAVEMLDLATYEGRVRHKKKLKQKEIIT
jgi:hypothetical protein